MSEPRKYLVVTGEFGPWSTLFCLIAFGMNLTEAVYEVSLMWHGHPDSSRMWSRIRSLVVTIALGAWIGTLRGRKVYGTVSLEVVNGGSGEILEVKETT